MTQAELTEFLRGETRGLPPGAWIAHLLEMGLIDHRLCEQLSIRRDVERLVRHGAGRCQAMEQSASRFCCSYAKVRQAVYYKSKN